VPPKLSMLARIFDVGHGRKNDPPAPAPSPAGAAYRNLRQVVVDDDTAAIRLMSERGSDVVESRRATMNHLHRLLMDLSPAGAQARLTTATVDALLATVRPTDVPGRTR
jgi:hypothetical protein